MVFATLGTGKIVQKATLAMALVGTEILVIIFVFVFIVLKLTNIQMTVILLINWSVRHISHIETGLL